MKTVLFLILSVFSLALFPLSALSVNHTNIVLTVRVQWSTNGLDWNEDQADFEDWDEFQVSGASQRFYTSQITNLWGSADPYEPMTLDNLWGDTVENMTNHLNYSTFYVVPNQNAASNILYRPMLSLTNYSITPPTECTNCIEGTNSPPPTIP